MSKQDLEGEVVYWKREAKANQTIIDKLRAEKAAPKSPKTQAVSKKKTPAKR